MRRNKRHMQRATLTVLLIGLALSTSCGLFHKRQPPPMPARPYQPPPEKPLAVAAPPELSEPPLLEPDEPASLEMALHIQLAEEIPPFQPRTKNRRARQTPAREGREEETVEAAVEVPEPAPQLVQMLSPEKRKEYDQLIDQNLNQAQKSLSAVSGRSLNAEQHESANLILAFIRQAKEAREQDPLRAQSLAERASVLAQHLEKSFR